MSPLTSSTPPPRSTQIAPAFTPGPVLAQACAAAASPFLQSRSHLAPRHARRRDSSSSSSAALVSMRSSLPPNNSRPDSTPSPRDRSQPLSNSSSNSSSPSAAGGHAPSANHSLTNLHELTERIADLLQVGSIHKNTLHCPKDAPLGYLSAKTHVAVVFGKHLIRDQITVEYAKRILTLIKQIASGTLNPDIICFTGGNGTDVSSTISEASAGYAFFRSICEEVNLDVSRFDIMLEEQSTNTKENLRNVIEELRSRSGPDVLSSCHFTLLSSDYHLIRIQEVHRLSPRQSVLFPLEVSQATWNCIFSAYPFCVSQDPPTAFLGRAVVLANDLGILRVNLKGALVDREFVSLENIHRLSETFAKMREMYRVIDSRSPASGGFRTDMRSHAETLELAIHNVREAHTILAPLQEAGSSVPRGHLELAFKLLSDTISEMRSRMDPDRALRLHDRISIVDDMLDYTHEQATAKAAASQAGPISLGRAPPPSVHNAPYYSTRSEFATPSSLSSSLLRGERRGRRSKSDVSAEVSWQGHETFKGNGKKIARDGPNLVITDSSAPAAVPRTPRRSTSIPPPARRSPQTVSGGALVRTVASVGDSTASASADAEVKTAVGSKASTSAAPVKRTRTRRRATTADGDALGSAGTGSAVSSRRSAGTGRGRSSSKTASSTKTTSASTTPAKKRKATTRKLATPSSSDSA